jgi:hypothetical protein
MLLPEDSGNFTGPWFGATDDWRSSVSSHGCSEASPLPLPVIAGLDPAIHPLRKIFLRRSMDARIKSGHDDDDQTFST